MSRPIFTSGMRLFLSTLILQISLPIISAQEKETVAILDFEGRGISQMEAQTLTDRFTSELASTNAMILVERNQMNEILDEQGFQQSGCTSAECAAEVGALLGVQHMVAGSFGKLGNSYTIDAKMFSVESGKTEKTVSTTYKGEIDGLLNEIEILAWEIMSLNPPEELLAIQRAGGQPIAAVAPAKEKGGLGWLFWTGLIVVGGAGAAFHLLGGADEEEPLPNPPGLPE